MIFRISLILILCFADSIAFARMSDRVYDSPDCDTPIFTPRQRAIRSEIAGRQAKVDAVTAQMNANEGKFLAAWQAAVHAGETSENLFNSCISTLQLASGELSAIVAVDVALQSLLDQARADLESRPGSHLSEILASMAQNASIDDYDRRTIEQISHAVKFSEDSAAALNVKESELIAQYLDSRAPLLESVKATISSQVQELQSSIAQKQADQQSNVQIRDQYKIAVDADLKIISDESAAIHDLQAEFKKIGIHFRPTSGIVSGGGIHYACP